MSNTPEYLESELPAIKLFEKLGYDYFPIAEIDNRNSIKEVILSDRLRDSIKRINPWISENNLNLAYRNITTFPASTLIEANEKIHKLLLSSLVIRNINIPPAPSLKGRGLKFYGLSGIE